MGMVSDLPSVDNEFPMDTVNVFQPFDFPCGIITRGVRGKNLFVFRATGLFFWPAGGPKSADKHVKMRFPIDTVNVFQPFDFPRDIITRRGRGRN